MSEDDRQVVRVEIEARIVFSDGSVQADGLGTAWATDEDPDLYANTVAMLRGIVDEMEARRA